DRLQRVTVIDLDDHIALPVALVVGGAEEHRVEQVATADDDRGEHREHDQGPSALGAVTASHVVGLLVVSLVGLDAVRMVRRIRDVLVAWSSGGVRRAGPGVGPGHAGEHWGLGLVRREDGRLVRLVGGGVEDRGRGDGLEWHGVGIPQLRPRAVYAAGCVHRPASPRSARAERVSSQPCRIATAAAWSTTARCLRPRTPRWASARVATTVVMRSSTSRTGTSSAVASEVA